MNTLRLNESNYLLALFACIKRKPERDNIEFFITYAIDNIVSALQNEKAIFIKLKHADNATLFTNE